MQKQKNILPVFLVSLGLVIVVMIFGVVGWLDGVQNGVSWTIFSVSQLISRPFSHVAEDSQDVNTLKQENKKLLSELSSLKTLQADNKALRDQFQAENSNPQKLLIATVVGKPQVIPNLSYPETFIINAGLHNGVRPGMAVIADNMIVGTVATVAEYYAEVSLVTSKESSFAGKESSTGAIGVVKGQGNGDILFQNVLLSDELKVGDMVVTSGSQEISGIGYPPNVIVGKITAVEKSPSALYQSARVSTLLPLDRLDVVFVMVK